MSASIMPERRSETRIAARLSVCIWGVDAEGNKFEQNVTATNVSGNGALLLGVERKTRFGDLIGIAHKGAKARFDEVSEGGMALTAGVELSPGDLVDVEFTPPYSGLPIRHRGVVRNRTGYRYGIEFLASNDRDAEQTARLLTMLTSM
jgi:hypothetical protein